MPAKKLHGYVKELADTFYKTGGRRGCLVGKFSLELAASSETFASLLSSMLTGWKASIEQVINEGQRSGAIRTDIRAAQLADAMLASIQGALVLDIANRRVGAMRSVEAIIPALLRPPR
ncbi:hypothetical protein AU476_18020 [Cupriavidus sp. UYMSc13B]|nr:hypothetical protein AU476_18020 [Cupriavidus sp. UYMSc13B]